jgi:hypothetical protein
VSAAARENALRASLAPFAPRRLDVSRRGSGLNAVWRITLDGAPAVLKTYDTRRGPVRTALTALEHRLSGRTPYAAAARQRTERDGLRLWRDAGFDVPALHETPLPVRLPVPHLCMEWLPGPTLPAFLTDAAQPDSAREDALRRFAPAWAARHALALERDEPRLLQEHATLDHVLVSGERLVTFDLEVAFRPGAHVPALIAREICGYLRSILRRLPAAPGIRAFEVLVAAYPQRDILDTAWREILANPRPAARLLHAIERRLAGRRPWPRHAVAARIRAAIAR